MPAIMKASLKSPTSNVFSTVVPAASVARYVRLGGDAHEHAAGTTVEKTFDVGDFKLAFMIARHRLPVRSGPGAGAEGAERDRRPKPEVRPIAARR